MYKYLEGGCQDDGPRLFSVVPSDKRQWAQSETQEVPSECQKMLVYSEGDRVQAQVAKGDYGVSFFREIQKPFGHGPMQVALGDPA